MCARHDARAVLLAGMPEVKVHRYRTEGQRQQGKGIARNGMSGGSMRQKPCSAVDKDVSLTGGRPVPAIDQSAG